MKNRLEELRRERGITQEELAAILEVSRQTISSLEKGRYNPSILLAGAWLLLRLLPGLDTTPWRAVPFLCLGVGCGLFGGGTGELLAVQAMKKHPELQKQNEIAERDERNVAIGNAAKAKGYDVMTFAFGAMLLFSVLMEADLALTLVMVAVYLFIQFYSLWWRFKLEKEM